MRKLVIIFVFISYIISIGQGLISLWLILVSIFKLLTKSLNNVRIKNQINQQKGGLGMPDKTKKMDFGKFVNAVRKRLKQMRKPDAHPGNSPIELNLDELIEALKTKDRIITPSNREELAAALTKILFQEEMAKNFRLEAISVRTSAVRGASSNTTAFKIIYEAT